MSAELPPKVLIVRLGAIGDVVNAQVVANAIREARPEVHIGWVVHELSRELLEGHPSVDRVHVWPRASGLAGFRRTAAELRGEGYGLALHVQRLAKSALLARASGAPRVLGFDRGRSRELSWLLSTERLGPARPGTHMVEWYLEFARHLGLPRPAVLHRFPPDPDAEAWADGLLENLGGAPVLVHLGASKPEKRWPPERAGALAAALGRACEAPVVFTGGPGDLHEVGPAEGAAQPFEPRSLVGATSLPQLVALAARARLFAGADTGPMHIAAAQGTPCVVLFGPGEPERTGPYGGAHRIVRSPTGHMRDLTVEHVLAAAGDLVPDRS